METNQNQPIRNKDDGLPSQADQLSDEEIEKILSNTSVSSNSTEMSDEELNKIISTCGEKEDFVEEKKLDLSHLSKKTKPVKKNIMGVDVIKRSEGANAHPTDTIQTMVKKELERQKVFKGTVQQDNKNQKLEELRNVKSIFNEPLQKADRKNILLKNELAKQDIQNEILKQRTILKDLHRVILVQKECNCIDQFAYFTPEGVTVTKCKFCSRIKEWKNVNDWSRYINQNKGSM